jgi:hypothetical protein
MSGSKTHLLQKCLSVLLAAIACLFLTGCASERVKITSTPPGAAVSIDGRLAGSTPLTADFISGKTYSVRAEMNGYLPAETKSCPVNNAAAQSGAIARGIGVGVLAAAGLPATTTNAPRHEPIVFVLEPLVNKNQVGDIPKH